MYERVMQLVNRIIKRRLSEQAFDKYQCFLSAGTYHLDAMGTCFIKLGIEDKTPVFDFAQAASRKKRRMVSRKRYHVKHDGMFFRGEKLLITSTGVAKIFDPGQKRVLTAFPDAKDMEAFLMQKEKARDVFHTAATKDVNGERLFVVEELLVDRAKSSEETWTTILKERAANCRYGAKEEREFPRKIGVERLDSRFKAFYAACGKSKIVLPVVPQHGDCWKANVFCDEGSVCRYIDFNDFGSYSLLYDLAHFLFTEAFVMHNHDLLRKYLNGAYDEEFKVICSGNDVDFMGAGREALFVCAVEEMISVKFSGKSREIMGESVLNFLNQYGLSI